MKVMMFDPAALKKVKCAAHDVEGAEVAVAAQQLREMCVHWQPEGVFLFLALDEIGPEGVHLDAGIAIDTVIKQIGDDKKNGDVGLDVPWHSGPAASDET